MAKRIKVTAETLQAAEILVNLYSDWSYHYQISELYARLRREHGERISFEQVCEIYSKVAGSLIESVESVA